MSKELAIGLIHETADYCPSCGQHTLLAMGVNGKPIHYIAKNKQATTQGIMEHINATRMGDFVCSNCKKHFLCDYTLGFPRAIQASGLNYSFFSGYFNHNR